MKKIVYFLVLFLCQKSFCETSNEDPYAPLKTFAESLHLIEKHYPKIVKRDQLIFGAVKGMLFELDPYSHFMTRKEAEAFQSQSHYGGLGIEVLFQEQKIIITSVFENSPAFKAGLQVGDILTHIKGQSVEKLSFDSATQKIRGQTGEKISLQILRAGQKKKFTITLERIRIPSVIGMKVSKNFFYVRILSFRDSTFKDLKKFLKKEFQNQDDPKGLLIDIRQNAGGIVDQALLSADLFISEGILAVIQSRNPEQNKTFHAKQTGTLPSAFPMVVLMDRYSASASEIFASTLQDNGRAVLVGEKSFGKGSIQSVFDIEPHSALKLTVAHYYSPQGRVIEQKGIQPDIKLPLKNYRSIIGKFKKRFQSVPKDSQKNPKWISMEKDSWMNEAFTVLSELSEQ